MHRPAHEAPVHAGEPYQDRLIAHWIKYMALQPEYIAGQIKSHFARAPWDEEYMRPQLDVAWRRMKESRNGRA